MTNNSSRFKPLIRGAWKKFWDAVRDADIVLEVLDPRDPLAFRMKDVEDRLKEMGKKIILVINKADLVPRDVLEAWKKVLSKEFPTIYISARHRIGTGKLRKLIYKIAGKKEEIRIAVVGFPNVGKSTIINILKGSHSAPTGALPGVTKALQKIRRGRLIILDTPGVFPIEDASSLVYKGALRVENLDDPVFHALELIEKLKELDKDVLKRTYGFDYEDPMEFLKEFAKRRGKLMKGGQPNIKEAAKIILRDWQNGKIVVWTLPHEYKG